MLRMEMHLLKSIPVLEIACMSFENAVMAKFQHAGGRLGQSINIMIWQSMSAVEHANHILAGTCPKNLQVRVSNHVVPSTKSNYDAIHIQINC